MQPNLKKLSLTAFGCAKKDFDVLKTLPKLEALAINGKCRLCGIDGIAVMSNLKSLSISRMDISNISAIGKLNDLEHLSLYGNMLVDIAPLASLTKLKSLSINNTSIRDISVLSGMTNLEDLLLRSNPITDIHPLSTLKGLKKLDLYNNGLKDISPIPGLNNLVELNLSTNRVNDISAIASLKNIETLDLSWNNITDISSLAGLTKLKILNLRSIKTSNIAALSELTNLEELKLPNNRINDISALKKLTKLKKTSEVGGSTDAGMRSQPLLENITNPKLDKKTRPLTNEETDRYLFIDYGYESETDRSLIFKVYELSWNDGIFNYCQLKKHDPFLPLWQLSAKYAVFYIAL